MRVFLLLLLLTASAGASAQEAYPLTADSRVQDVPHGTVERTVLPPGIAYPGASHAVAIYTPADAGSGPLPYMIFLDGSSWLGGRLQAATVLDNLIAHGQIPQMLGIFVDPGVLPAVRPDAQSRYERVFEYDSLSARYGTFLRTEVLPFVARRHALSADPDAHAIAGISTGAVGAFVAAWHRPDEYHRVLSLIGTFVAMKGADTLPELVRKTEPRPLRVWMQDGANDHLTADEPYGTFFAGTWPLANQAMFDALRFGGYDVKLTMGTGGHDTDQGAAELPEALRWLWRGAVMDRVEVHSPAALHAPGFDTRGSVWSTVDAVGRWEAVADAMPEPRLISRGFAYGVRNGAVTWTGTAGEGRALRLPGAQASAAALSPDGAMLAVTDAAHRHQWSLQLQENGTPADAEPFYRLETMDGDGGATGAAFDSLGQVYFATALGVQVCEANGRVAMILNSPVADRPVERVAFGGPGLQWLYVLVDGRVFRRKMQTHAAAADRPEKPPQPPL